ncbi:MAG: 5-formyltetrahydrofolate cyclo-ligase [Parasporobacterium sp.]|nr:5-formyltetrahydrofolate cyclo-ligase [Parasporobacterium sp.]
MMEKNEIRKEVTEKKDSLSREQVEEWSLQLKEKFCSLDVYKEAECIYFYLSFNNEVQTTPMIEQALSDGKRAAVPVTLASGKTLYKDGRPKRDYMEFIYLDSMDELSPGYMGIPEPDPEIVTREPERVADEKKVLILMPGLAFDRSGNRIGYGGGFYDKYLSGHPATEFIKVALGFDFQLYETIPTEPHDEKMDRIITPSFLV